MLHWVYIVHIINNNKSSIKLKKQSNLTTYLKIAINVNRQQTTNYDKYFIIKTSENTDSSIHNLKKKRFF